MGDTVDETDRINIFTLFIPSTLDKVDLKTRELFTENNLCGFYVPDSGVLTEKKLTSKSFLKVPPTKEIKKIPTWLN